MLCLHDALAPLLIDLICVAGTRVDTLADDRKVCVVDATLSESVLVVREILAPLDSELLALLDGCRVGRVLFLLLAKLLVRLSHARI